MRRPRIQAFRDTQAADPEEAQLLTKGQVRDLKALKSLTYTFAAHIL